MAAAGVAVVAVAVVVAVAAAAAVVVKGILSVHGVIFVCQYRALVPPLSTITAAAFSIIVTLSFFRCCVAVQKWWLSAVEAGGLEDRLQDSRAHRPDLLNRKGLQTCGPVWPAIRV